MIIDVPKYLRDYVNRNGRGLTKKGRECLFGLKSVIDFDDCFGVRDMFDAQVLENHVTQKQDDEIWDKLRETYRNERVSEVLAFKYN